jgi:hypothetical protein
LAQLNLKAKGDLAEIRVTADLLSRGYRIAFPFGEDFDFDLVLVAGKSLLRVQVKYAASDGAVIPLRCTSHSLTNGKVRRTKHYTAETIDLLAVYDRGTDSCYYLPATDLGTGRSLLHLRLAPAKNGQRIGTRLAHDYRDPDRAIEAASAAACLTHCQ